MAGREPAGRQPGRLNPRLTSRGVVTDLLARHGLRPDKSFGQNFLVDQSALMAVVEAAEIQTDQTVLEFGPGLGVLTRELAQRAGRVIAVELDSRMLPVLHETLAGFDNVTVLHQDALEFDYSQLPSGSSLVANLPYNVATRLVSDALESGRLTRLVAMVQREVAERMRAGVGQTGFGAYSLLIEHFAEARIVRDVAPGCFLPPPEVTSSIIRLDVREAAGPDPALFRLIRRSFAHRRKTLRRNLMMAGYPADTVLHAMASLQLDNRVRAEELSLERFRLLLAALESAD